MVHDDEVVTIGGECVLQVGIPDKTRKVAVYDTSGGIEQRYSEIAYFPARRVSVSSEKDIEGQRFSLSSVKSVKIGIVGVENDAVHRDVRLKQLSLFEPVI